MDELTPAAGCTLGRPPYASPVDRAWPPPTLQLLAFTTVGNHEFDEGYRELLWLVRGGCAVDAEPDPHPVAAGRSRCPASAAEPAVDPAFDPAVDPAVDPAASTTNR